MCNHRLQDPSLVVNALDFRSALDPKKIAADCEQSEDMSDEAFDFLFEQEFARRLTGYLQGAGHPNHPDVRSVVGEERFSLDSGDPLLRARLFLHMISGSDLVPNGDGWRLKVCGALVAWGSSLTRVSRQIFFRHRGRRQGYDLLPEVAIPAPVRRWTSYWQPL